MPSSDRAALAGLLLTVLALGVRAEPASPESAYKELMARESAVREELAAASAARQAAVARKARALTADYEDLARRNPTSGYSDNALWQGALLASDVFHRLGQQADRQTARRLLQALTDRFRTSSLIPKVPAVLAALESPSPAAPPSNPPPRSAPKTATSPAPPPAATLTDIQHEVRDDAVRVTLLLDAETPFNTEQLSNPARLSIDLQNTRALYALKDARLTFSDDVVRQIRVGRQADARTRVVIDLDGPARSSIYPVYNPYRLVIDFERTGRSNKPVSVAWREDARPAAGGTATRSPASTASSSVSPRTPGQRPGVSTNASPAATGGRTTTKPPTTAASAAGRSAPGAAPPTPPSANTRGGFSLSRQLGLGISRIVIDPGHGGHDPGARANGLTEAELALDVALRLERRLLEQPGVEVTLTRRTSEFIPLDKRTEIANKASADLFLSIHANASENDSARGIETYFLNFAPDDEAAAIAARENAGSDKSMRNLPDMVRAIALNNKIDESRDFAKLVQDRLYNGLKKNNRQAKNLGVKQAPFQVLIGAAMPSILAEISFITHPQEATLLKTDKYREHIAESLFNGVMAYQKALKKGEGGK
ncbi:MAG TPA: N-acetylmuramoyl-L-alanine amidase [Vicinamibacterales bacterium]|nr:N-acetylmuramoyl-L-alanine amidase [Vicinamibacterales bacterium]